MLGEKEKTANKQQQQKNKNWRIEELKKDRKARTYGERKKRKIEKETDKERRTKPSCVRVCVQQTDRQSELNERQQIEEIEEEDVDDDDSGGGEKPIASLCLIQFEYEKNICIYIYMNRSYFM